VGRPWHGGLLFQSEDYGQIAFLLRAPFPKIPPCPKDRSRPAIECWRAAISSRPPPANSGKVVASRGEAQAIWELKSWEEQP